MWFNQTEVATAALEADALALEEEPEDRTEHGGSLPSPHILPEKKQATKTTSFYGRFQQ